MNPVPPRPAPPPAAEPVASDAPRSVEAGAIEPVGVDPVPMEIAPTDLASGGTEAAPPPPTRTVLVLDPKTMLADVDPATLLTRLLAEAHGKFAPKVAHIPGIFGEA